MNGHFFVSGICFVRVFLVLILMRVFTLRFFCTPQVCNFLLLRVIFRVILLLTLRFCSFIFPLLLVLFFRFSHFHFLFVLSHSHLLFVFSHSHLPFVLFLLTLIISIFSHIDTRIVLRTES